MASNDEVVQVEYVYDEKKDLPMQEGSIFSEPYYKDNSDSNDGEPPSNANLSDNKSSKRSKPKRQKSRYDEDNYALPDSDSDGGVRSTKVDDKITKLEEKFTVQGRQIVTWRILSIVLIILLSVVLGANYYLDAKTAETSGKNWHNITNVIDIM